jgi:hypothetical protein
VKHRLGDYRGGSEWEPIKILLQRENPAYTPNSQPRIPTRVCQGHVVTADLPTLGTNPKRSQSGSTIQEAKDLAVLQQPWRTVRDPRADGLLPTGGRSDNHNRMTRRAPNDADGPYLVLKRSVPGPRTGCEQLVPRGRSATPTRTVRQTPSGQNQTAK